MQNLFYDVGALDQRCYTQFGLSEELLMEHAADGMNAYIRARVLRGKKVLIVCGSGNNGADGLALARLLCGDYDVAVLLPWGVKSPLSRVQHKRLEALHVSFIDALEPCDVLVDALLGSGAKRALEPQTQLLLEQMNALDALKIACDLPSGLDLEGCVSEPCFKADVTLTMGALKRGLFSDAAKEVVGVVEVIDLGLSRLYYESESTWHLLEAEDLLLPHRVRSDSHKGSYGHLGVLCGEKSGAAVLCGSAAMRFGAGLVSLLSNEKLQLPYELMQCHTLPSNLSALCLGMGLGQEFCDRELRDLLNHSLPLLIDADLFYHPLLCELLEREQVILTPHPKEFCALYSACGLGTIDVATLQNDRFGYALRFCAAYPHVVLLLKGANVIIAQNDALYVNPHGSAILAKGGSGDVLGGLIGALLAQGYAPLDAAIHGSLAHTLASKRLTCNDYAMNPFDLIDAVGRL